MCSSPRPAEAGGSARRSRSLLGGRGVTDMRDPDQKRIQTRLSILFSEVLHVEVPSVDTDLFDTGILDSQRFVELLLFIEQNFDTHIDIQDFEIENFRCIEKIAT